MAYDVIIVGAGPAGSTCAYTCAKKGLNVLLLDRENFPRRKPCGGAVSAQALSRLDFSLPPEVVERECFGVRVHLGSHHTEVSGDRRIAVMVRRDRFDHYLAEQAVAQGAAFRQGEPVIEASPEQDGVEVMTGKGRYQARYLVGADGANSLVARLVRPPFLRSEIAAAVVCEVPDDDAAIEHESGSSLDLTYGIAPRGYGWVFPHRGHRSVGVMGLASEFSGAKACLDGFLRSRGMGPAPSRGHSIPYGGIRRPVTSGRILLAGDAAGFTDAFQGEGIVHAIHSGTLAAQAVDDAIRGRAEALAWYAGECERGIGRHLRVALRMASLLERYPDLFLTLFFRRSSVLSRYLDIPAGRSDYVRFRRWLVPRLPWYLLEHGIRMILRKDTAD